MGKVVGSTNKESGTNSYAKNNQSAIKALATVGKAAATAGSVVGGAVKQVYNMVKDDLGKKVERKKIKKQKQKEMEAVDV
tara:strand:+ start:57 stop:296 length:240 start_codon:yes stop_codon:yes gene_type:complete